MTSGSSHIQSIKVGSKEIRLFSIADLCESLGVDVRRMPYSIRVLVESLLRQEDGRLILASDVETIARWSPDGNGGKDIPFIPARVVLQDFTGVPAVVDLAAMRSAVADMGGDANKINPLIPVDLVIDHSVQVDEYGHCAAREANERLEMERNRERYSLLKWAQSAFRNFRAVPPGNGIIHQVNLEYLAPLVHLNEDVDGLTAYPDSCFGTDSHTTQINGLGVIGWGVGGIEAEAVMLGQPYYMPVPDVIGMRLTGRLRPGVNATDLVLTVVEILRKRGVVGKFVEYFGPGYRNLDLADRSTLANMAPEYGATMGYCPIDERTMEYLRLSGRDEGAVDTVEAYVKANMLWYDEDPDYTEIIELDLSSVEPCLAGPKRPQDRVPLSGLKDNFLDHLASLQIEKKEGGKVNDGSVVIASITSCTNTANPTVMVGAGILARNAVEKGLEACPWVKTSLSPGSKVVTRYLDEGGLTPYLDRLGFHNTGYGCMTCIGNSGPLDKEVRECIEDNDLVAAAVVSANRNFEGRVSPHVKANYLASPQLVIAFAIAGRVDIDLEKEPLGLSSAGEEVYLRDIWPSDEEVEGYIRENLDSHLFKEEYSRVFEGSELWDGIEIPEGGLFEWDQESTYIRNPPFFKDLRTDSERIEDLQGARSLAYLGDSVTTDHISPAGPFGPDSDAGRYLISKGVKEGDFNSYGSRRGNHEVMMRGTFANIRLRNRMAPGTEGGWSVYLPEEEVATMFETSRLYEDDGTPLIIIAGKEYGTGSSRDWAAKGPYMLGIKAVLAESFERIHRSNLIGMGIVPLQFLDGDSAESLGLNGREEYHISLGDMRPRGMVCIRAIGPDGEEVVFDALSRVDAEVELDYIRNGGILPTVLKSLVD